MDNRADLLVEMSVAQTDMKLNIHFPHSHSMGDYHRRLYEAASRFAEDVRQVWRETEEVKK